MTETTLAKGVMFGTCFTTGCSNSGRTVKGIPGQPNMWKGNDANFTHRCEECHALIHAILDLMLATVQREENLPDEKDACAHESFVGAGKTVLSMDLDQLKGAKL